jgi:hypothetical protein
MEGMVILALVLLCLLATGTALAQAPTATVIEVRGRVIIVR